MRANQSPQYSTEMDISPPWSDKIMDTSKTPFPNLEIPVILWINNTNNIQKNNKS